MATPTRIYLVTDQADGGSYLVRAQHPARAIGRITNDRYLASVATQEEIVEMFALGGTVIDGTGAEPESAEPAADNRQAELALQADTDKADAVVAPERAAFLTSVAPAAAPVLEAP